MRMVRLVRRRWLYPALGCWSALWFAILARHGGIAWKFFSTGTSLLFGAHPAIVGGITGGSDAAGPAGLPGPPPPGGLHLYASYPALQIGPFSYLVTAVLRYLGPHSGLVAAELFLQAAGLLIVYLIERIARIARPALARPALARPALARPALGQPAGRLQRQPAGQARAFRLTLLAGGAVFIVAWTELAVAFTHLDDGLALLLAVLAVRAAVSPLAITRAAVSHPAGAAGHPVLAGLCIGLAVDAKPWALVFLPVLLMFSGRRPLVTAALTAAATIAAGWLPFFIADPGTVTATKYLIRNEPMSALRALGVHQDYTPSWDRTAQALLGCVLGGLAIRRGRWPAVLLLAGGARILLDPAAHSYYTPDVMVGALLWDILGSRRPFPLWTIVSFAALNVVPLVVPSAAVQGAIRLGLVAAFTVAVLALPLSSAPEPRVLLRDRLPAPPDPPGRKPVGPDERALVVGVPQHHVGELATRHRTAIGSTQRVRAADGRRPQRFLDAHPEVRHGQRDHQCHRRNAGAARGVVGAERDHDALVQQRAYRRPGAHLQRGPGAHDRRDT